MFELADPTIVRSLVMPVQEPLAARTKRRFSRDPSGDTARRFRPAQAPLPTIPAQAMPEIRRRRTCLCGACPKCRENARWERIFLEKFADPDYYQPKPLRHCSSLNVD